VPLHEVTLEDVAALPETSDHPIVIVDLLARRVKRRILVHTARENGEWRISNIVYDQGEDFVAYRRRLRGH